MGTGRATSQDAIVNPDRQAAIAARAHRGSSRSTKDAAGLKLTNVSDRHDQ